jgi:hypothetical protein
MGDDEMEVRHVTLSVEEYNRLIVEEIQKQFSGKEVRIEYHSEDRQWWVTFDGKDPNEMDLDGEWVSGEFNVDNGDDDRIHFSGPMFGSFYVELPVVDDSYRPIY